MRFQGRPSLGISVATQEGGDITGTGIKIAEKLEQIKAELPAGIEIDRIAWQGDLVKAFVYDRLHDLDDVQQVFHALA